MIFKHVLTSSNESNAFIVACENSKDAFLIDAGEWESELDRFIEEQGLRLTGVFITHDHYDHTGGVDQAVKRDGAALYAGSSHAGGRPAERSAHGDEVRIGEMTGRVLAVPGHTQDSICLALPGHVFTGDALFAGSIGGTGTPSAKKQLMDGIREHIFSLPPDTLIHTGHGPSSTVAIESRYNPFFV